MFDFKSDEAGSVFVGSRVYDSAKMTASLKMFDNVLRSVPSTTATVSLSNTNTNTVKVNRGAA